MKVEVGVEEDGKAGDEFKQIRHMGYPGERAVILFPLSSFSRQTKDLAIQHPNPISAINTSQSTRGKWRLASSASIRDIFG